MNPNETLTDRFGRRHSYLRISVTDRCNLRCTYCMPHEEMTFQPREALLTYEEIHRLAGIFVSLGVDKIRITGGEPLVRSNLEVLLRQLSALPGLKTLAMTTNAVLLAQQTESLKSCGLQALNISLDTLRPERFSSLTRRANFEDVMTGIHSALNTGFETLKLNVVAIKGFNDDEIMDFVEFVKDKPINLRFIEYMPFKDNEWSAFQLLPYREIQKQIEARYRLQLLESEPSAVARDYALFTPEGERLTASVSFITSMTNSFCSTCSRLRLTADGQLKACLFQPAEINLRDAMRAGARDVDIIELIQQALSLKQEAHEPLDELMENRDLNRPMIAIGG